MIFNHQDDCFFHYVSRYITYHIDNTLNCMLPVPWHAHKAWAALLLKHATSSLLGITALLMLALKKSTFSSHVS